MKNTRKIVLTILNDIEKQNSYSNIVLDVAISKYNLEGRDKNFVFKIVYGVLENKILLDYYISKISSTKLKKIDGRILNLLRMSLFQIIFLDKVPNSAVVDEAVKLVKSINYKSKAFVNAILRNFIRKYEQIELPDKQRDKVNYYSVKYSYPSWIIDRWLNEYGEKFVSELLIEYNKPPMLNLRVNTLKTDRNSLIDILTDEGLVVKNGMLEESIVVESITNTDIKSLKSYDDGLFFIQDEASMMVAKSLGVLPNMKVIDVCSAPGGKSTHIAQIMENKGEIVAFDIYEHKLNKIEQNATRLGIDIIHTYKHDSKEINSKYIEFADRVLVDAPCSGFGIIRRKPEIKYSRTLEDIHELTKIQYEILESSSKYVKPSGTLVYSTCSIESIENEFVVNSFLKNHSDFKLSEEGMTKLFPNVNGTDGFFIAVLKRAI